MIKEIITFFLYLYYLLRKIQYLCVYIYIYIYILDIFKYIYIYISFFFSGCV